MFVQSWDQVPHIQTLVKCKAFKMLFQCCSTLKIPELDWLTYLPQIYVPKAYILVEEEFQNILPHTAR